MNANQNMCDNFSTTVTVDVNLCFIRINRNASNILKNRLKYVVPEVNVIELVEPWKDF